MYMQKNVLVWKVSVAATGEKKTVQTLLSCEWMNKLSASDIFKYFTVSVCVSVTNSFVDESIKLRLSFCFQRFSFMLI